MKLLSSKVAIPGVALVVLAGCGKEISSPEPSDLPAVTVRVQRVESKPVVATEEVVGTVRARLRSVIEAKVTARIGKMLVVPGEQVKAGDPLAELDAREVSARADQARAVRQQAEADLNRATTLFEQRIFSQSEFDAAQSRFRVAEAGALEAETLLGYTKVNAPFDGVITRKHADMGDLATPGKPLLEMEDARSLRLEADVPEAVANSISLGDRLPVRIAALETNLAGVVSEIAPAATSESRTFLVKLDLPAVGGLRAGQFGRLTMPVGNSSALTVPAAAVVQRGQMELVFVADAARARMRIVKSGRRADDGVEIVSGLSAGELIVIEGAAQLRDGQPLVVQP